MSVRPGLARLLAGLALTVLIAAALWAGVEYSRNAASIHRLTGLDDLRPLSPWLQVLRWPAIAVLAVLFLTLVSWLLRRLRLGA